MKRVALICIESKWHSRNLDSPDEYLETHIFGNDDLLITFQSSELIRHLKTIKQFRKWPEIVDMESFEKQMAQEGKDLRQAEKWKMGETLKRHNIPDPDFKLSQQTAKQFLGYMCILYEWMLTERPEEKKRFENIETEVNRLIYRRQASGVPVNMTIAADLSADLERKIYQAKNELQLKYRIFDPGNEQWQHKYLKEKGYSLVKSLLFTFKSKRNEDKICSLLYDMIRNQKDFDSLLFMQSHWGGKERAYPKYLGFGTITSRIILREPSFQNLRKTNRKVVVADRFHKLLYIDYSQFEAGILASLSDDNKLIDLYNKDIYEDLANFVYADHQKRSDAKVIFYRYMYGDTSLGMKEQQYFKKFTKLQQYKQDIDKELSKESRVGTKFGNFRVKGNEEVTWALSHVIQATASLIYKNALIRVSKEVERAKFLIPMHDGTVYQIFSLWYEVVKGQVETIYIEEFKKVCPKLNCKVNVKEVFE